VAHCAFDRAPKGRPTYDPRVLAYTTRRSPARAPRRTTRPEHALPWPADHAWDLRVV